MKKIGLNILGMYLVGLLVDAISYFKEIDFLSLSGWGYLTGGPLFAVSIAAALGGFFITFVWIIKRKIWYGSITLMWIAFAILTVGSIYGEYAMGRDKRVSETYDSMPNDKDVKEISNEYIKFTVPSDWEHQYPTTEAGQLYIVFCYSNTVAFRISSTLNVEQIDPIDYYWNFKNLIFKKIKNEGENLTIIEEKSSSLLGYDAFIVEYKYTLDNINIHAKNIIFKQEQQLVQIVLTTHLGRDLDKEFNKIMMSLVFK